MPAKLRNGNIGAPGGARPGAGRKPDEFKEWLKGLVHDPKSRRRLEKIIQDADDADEIVTSEGVCVPHRAKAATYLQAVELAWSYERGKPNQPLELNDTRERPSAEDIQAALTILRANSTQGTGVDRSE